MIGILTHECSIYSFNLLAVGFGYSGAFPTSLSIVGFGYKKLCLTSLLAVKDGYSTTFPSY
jgi:hypothetical protein